MLATSVDPDQTEQMRRLIWVNADRLCITVGFLFVCVDVLRPSQPIGVMSSAVNLPNHTFTGQT